MRAAQISEYGGPEALQVTDQAPQPEPKPGQVLVEVHAAGVNPFDIKVSEGLAQLPASVEFPATLGGDFAGVVAALGEGVSNYEVGQAVFGEAGAMSGHGSFAEFTPVKVASIAPKPESVDFVTAAASPLVCASAYQALVEHIQLEAGQKILIHGGAGGIGSVAIQLAKYLGGHVITTAAAEDVDFVKKLGADEVIDYKSQDFSLLASNLDAVFDTVGGETNKKSYITLKASGMLVSMVEEPDEELVSQYQTRYIHQSTNATTERLTKATELINSGDLIINVDKIFPLEEAGEALEYLKTGHPKGKVVIQVA